MRRLRRTFLIILVCLMLMAPVLNSCSGLQHQATAPGFHYFRGEGDEQRITSFWSRIRPLSTLSAAHYNLGRFYQARDKHVLAAEAFRRAVRADPENIKAYNGLGIACDAIGEHDAAQEAFNAAISLRPNDAYLYNNLGWSHLQQGENGEAIEVFEKALTLAGQSERISNNLTLARTRSTENSGATAPQEVATTNDPDVESLDSLQPLIPGRDLQVVTPAVPDAVEGEQEVTTPADDGYQPPDLTNIGVEVANGNGVNGMARKSAEYLKGKGVAVRRITNAADFTLGKTKILYKEGYLQEAYSLAQLVPGYQEVEFQSSLERADIKMKIILGRDLARMGFPQSTTNTAALSPPTPSSPPQLLAGNTDNHAK